MKKKELVFRSAETVEFKSIKTLKIYCYGDGEISVNDGEIIENENSAEVVAFTHEDPEENQNVILVHKKDILPLASFLLDIYNNYAKRQDEMLFEDYSEYVRSQIEKERRQ